MSKLSKLGWMATALLLMAMLLTWVLPADTVGRWLHLVAGGALVGLVRALGILARDARRKRPFRWAQAQFSIGMGAAANLAFYAALAHVYGPSLDKAVSELTNNIGCQRWHLDNDLIQTCAQNRSDDIILRDPYLAQVPPKIERAFRASEDVRHSTTMFAVDPIALARAVRYGGRQGGSGIAQQVVRPLMQWPHEQHHSVHAFWVKLKVIGVASVLDGTMTRKEEMATYASVVTFAQVGDVQINGVPVAARMFFGKTPTELDDAEAFELAALLHAPSAYYPYSRPGEREEAVASRRKAMFDHVGHALDNAANHKIMSRAEADYTLKVLGNTFLAQNEFIKRLPPSMGPVRAQLAQTVPDWRLRYLEVESAWSPHAQAALDAAVTSGLDRVRLEVPPEYRNALQADAAVVSYDGGVMAVRGLYNAFTDVGSVQKVVGYTEARETNLLINFRERIDGMPADWALAKSDDVAACWLIANLGPHQYAAVLDSMGFSVTNPALVVQSGYNSICLGAGVKHSPMGLAAFLRAYSERQTGILITPSFFRRIVDLRSGAVLVNPQSRRIVPAAIANEVRIALAQTPRIGTLRSTLGDIGGGMEVWGKTGTAHALQGGVLRGGGGSWAVVASSRLHVTIAVRIQTKYGDVPIDGGPGAGPLAHDFLINMVMRGVRR